MDLHEDPILEMVKSQRQFLELISRESTNISHQYLDVANINQQLDPEFDQENVVHETTKNLVAFLLSQFRRSSQISIDILINGLQAIIFQTVIIEQPHLRNVQCTIYQLQNRITCRMGICMALPIIHTTIDEYGDDESKEWLELLNQYIVNIENDLDYIMPMTDNDQPDHIIPLIHSLYI